MLFDWLTDLFAKKPAAVVQASVPTLAASATEQVTEQATGQSVTLLDQMLAETNTIEQRVELLVQMARRDMARLTATPDRIEARYDGAQTTFALKNHWQMADNLSADAANSLDVRRVLRERSRLESSNNSYLCGMLRTLANDVVGVGASLQMLTPNERLNTLIEKSWKAWSKEIKLTKKLRLARETMARDGEVFLLLTTNKKLRHAVKLDVKVIEADQVEDYFHIPTPEQPVSGIELDDDGNVVKYHVLKQHPGSAVLWSTNPYDFDEIDAQFVVHLFKSDRPGQHRGVPETTSSLSLFAILRAYTMSVLDAARIAGTLNYCIGTKSNLVPPAQIKNAPAFTPLSIPPGTIPLLPEGYEPFQMDMQKPVTGFDVFSDQIVNQAARPLSMPRNIATGNSSGYNFSSAKMDKMTYYNAVAIDQADMGEDGLDPILFAFLEELEALGELDLEPGEEDLGPFEEWEHEYEWPTPEPVDELKTANANQINMQTGKLALGPTDLIRMQTTARYLGLTLEQYRQLIVKLAFSGAVVTTPTTPEPPVNEETGLPLGQPQAV